MTEDPTDATLLERFVNDREEAAFEVLVDRHAPRVRRACRRILRDEHAAEDAVQATFLVLAGKAAGIPWRDSIGAWLQAVACRVALHARSGALRRGRREIPLAVLSGGATLPEAWHPRVDTAAEIALDDLRRVIGEEVDRLPDVYRWPMELCYLEGLTNQEAARRLGWPSGSISRRMVRGRAILRGRLASRGLLLAVVLLGAVGVAFWHVEDRSLSSMMIRPGPISGRSGTEAVRVPNRPAGDPGPPSRTTEPRAQDLLAWAVLDEPRDPTSLRALLSVDASCRQCHVVLRE